MERKTCTGCNKTCGKVVTIRGSSGIISYIKVPDKECKVKQC